MAGFAHHVGKSVVLGYVPIDLATIGTHIEAEILGRLRPAKVQGKLLYDTNGGRMRA